MVEKTIKRSFFAIIFTQICQIINLKLNIKLTKIRNKKIRKYIKKTI